jgi:transposase-like protein
VPRTRPPYPEEFRREAIRLAQLGDKPPRRLAKDLGISDVTLRGWLKEEKAAKGERLTITPAHRTVVVSWRRSAGASNYVLVLKVYQPRATIYAPVLLRTTRFVSKQTLPNLHPGAVATVTVIALGPTGAESTASRIHYRAS